MAHRFVLRWQFTLGRVTSRLWNDGCNEYGGVVQMRGMFAVFTAFSLLNSLFAQQKVVPDAPEVRGAFTLAAAQDSQTGHNAFSFKGNTVPPIIRVLPGGKINL